MRPGLPGGGEYHLNEAGAFFDVTADNGGRPLSMVHGELTRSQFVLTMPVGSTNGALPRPKLGTSSMNRTTVETDLSHP